MPLLAFSDPTLSYDNEINLSWYAGNKDINNLAEEIAVFLDRLICNLGVKLVLFGGSGGGFASLAVSSLMSSKVSVLVWNPQTSISNYSARFVDAYLMVAFGLIATSSSERRLLLKDSGVHHEVFRKNFNDNVKVVYLQNLSDSHTVNHCAPFFRKCMVKKMSLRSFSSGENFLLYFGAWGKGHYPAPREMIIYTLKELINNKKTSYFCKGLELLDQSTSCVGLLKDEGLLMSGFSLEAFVFNEKIYVSFYYFDDEISSQGLKYAFYLNVDGVRKDFLWYSDSPKCIFNFPVDGVEIQVVGFVKDVFNEKIKVISLNP